MLVYRTARRSRRTADLLQAFQSEAARLAGTAPVHGEVRDLLVSFDELESALADALNPDRDDESPVQLAFRGTALELGRIFLHSRDGRRGAARKGLRLLAGQAASLFAFDLPATVQATEAEGYAWYGLYPETYLAAARRFQAEAGPQAAVCLGIRQIGASLSAVVAAALAEAGCPVTLHTVRPRGAPFERQFLPSPKLAAQLRAAAGSAHFLIIDEGPGLSGSSFCSIAETLSSWGISDRRIVFFPSWLPDGTSFRSPTAYRRWPRHRKFLATAEEISLPSLGEFFPGHDFLDLSAGHWRPLLLGDRGFRPPVHPQHERRKLLVSPAGTSLPDSPERWQHAARSLVLAKFAGFGRRGRAALQRARRLAALGFAPPTLGLVDGFLLTLFVPGLPLTRRDASPGFLESAAAYLARLRTDFPAAGGTSPGALAEMTRNNIAEALGEGCADRLVQLVEPGDGGMATDLDARMFPHEWLATPQGFLKVDGIEHHDDHFFPGPTDIAWDLAAAGIEFRLTPAQLESLVRRYAVLSGDTEVARRLLFYRLAYLAFRLGYTRLAAESLAGTDEGVGFRAAANRYARLLQAAAGSE